MPRRSALVRASAVMLLATLAGLACRSLAAEKEEKPVALEGRYSCVGTTAEGAPYRGTMRISKVGDAYMTRWDLEAGDSYGGIGVLTGDVFSVGWQAGDMPGVISYRVEKQDGKLRLVGRWTAPGLKGKLFDETLTPML